MLQVSQPVRIYVFLCSAFLVTRVAAQELKAPQRQSHQTFQTGNGLPQNSVHAIAQTHDGYIWFGTEGGLARFDGLQFTIFDSQNTPALKSNTIRALLEDAQQDLWIATAGGLNRLHEGKFSLFTTAQGLPTDDVFSLFQDAQHQLLALTSEGIAQFENGGFITSPYLKPLLGSNLSAIAEWVHGSLLLGTRHGLKVAQMPGSQSSFRPSQADSVNIQALLVDSRERLWIGTTDGLLLSSGGRTTSIDRLPNRKILTLYEDRSRNIWIGTEAGAAEIVGGDANHVLMPEALSRGPILSFLQDREGSLWIGTDTAGVTVLRDEKFRTFGHVEGVPEDLIRCVLQDGNGQIWIGTNGSGLFRLGDRIRPAFTTKDGLASNVVLSLAEDAKGRLLVGTPDGLNIFDGQTVRTLTSADGLPDDFIRSIFPEVDGSLWLGTRRGLAHISDHFHTNLTAADGLLSEFVGSVLRGRDGCLWIGTRKGLARLKDGKITTRLPGGSLPGTAVTSLFEDSQGTLWIGTAEGLMQIAGERLLQFPASLGLPQTIFGIVEDSDHQLWITSANGLFRVDRKDLNSFAKDRNHVVSVVTYGTADGLPVNAFSEGGHPTVLQSADGTLWFASTKGLVSIDKTHSAPNSLPPPVVLESVSIDDRSVTPAQAVDLAPGLFRIAFAYAGLSFVTPQKIRYRYRLEGFDREWVEAGTRRVAYYTNLAPGKYRFAVLACNSDGIWNNSGAVFSFRLRPHFYQTVWFYVLVALLAFSLIYALYRWRVAQVQTQFDAVLAERTRIAREIHDTLAQGFVAVSVQLELVNRVLPSSIESATQLLFQTRTLVQESLAEARRSIWDLRSGNTSDQNLSTRVSQSARNSIKNTTLELNFHTVGAYRPLPPKTEDEILRISQEAVANVVRHAHASQVAITLSYDSNKALMQVSDNGRGFAVHPLLQGPEGHFGLRGMRERAASIDALLTVVSSPESGTQLSLEIPLS